MYDTVRQKMLKFTFNALIQQHIAERHRPTMFHTATVSPRRSGPKILYNTPLTGANLDVGVPLDRFCKNVLRCIEIFLTLYFVIALD